VRKILLICLLVGPVAAMLGCETIKGLGRDITRVGEALDEATR